jgi:uncharacterized protein (DUF433 family)
MEKWSKIKNFEDRYEISNYGRLKRLAKIHPNSGNLSPEMILKPPISQYGYNTTLLTKEGGERINYKIHRLVAEYFVHNQNPDEFQIVNHIDGDKLNNHYTNLEWTNAQGNVTHAIKNGLRKHSIHQALNKKQVREIRELYDNSDIYVDDLAESYDVTTKIIIDCITYATYRHIDDDLKNTYSVIKNNEEIRRKYKKKVYINQIEEMSDENKKQMVYDYVNAILPHEELISKYEIHISRIKEYVYKLNPKPEPLSGEVFKEVNEDYEISNLGRVFNKKYNKITDTNSIKGENKYRIIAKLFLPNPNNHKHVIFKDGDKSNINLDNLYWGTSQKTVWDIHSKETIEEIRRIYTETKATRKEIAERFNIPFSAILQFIKGYSKPPKLIDYKVKMKPQLTEEEKKEVIRLYFEDLVILDELKKQFSHVSGNMVYEIIKVEKDKGRKQGKVCQYCGTRDLSAFKDREKTSCKTCVSKRNKERYRKKNGRLTGYKKEFVKQAFEDARQSDISFDEWFEKNA